MKITVAGIGYVGLSLAVLLSENNEVYAYDIACEKVNMINKRISPIKDAYIEEYLKKDLNLIGISNYERAFKDSSYIVIATPTNYDEVTNCFDTSSVEDIINKVKEMNIDTTIIIKSTVPIGFTKRMSDKYKLRIIFSPEFLREGKALYDNLYPSRIIIGSNEHQAHIFGEMLKKCSLNNPCVLYMESSEAEAVKLFANTYLALRISFFNELDTYAEIKGLDSKSIIEGVCLDSRIGNFYNNPSFGYGGYCLPKDTKQLLANYRDVPQNLIEAIVRSNDTRKDYIADMIKNKNVKTIGIYRLIMKKNSDNFRDSAIIDIIEKLNDFNIIIYEPTINEFRNYSIVNDLYEFNERCDLIIANRLDDDIKKLTKEIYTRDLFNKD